MEMVLLVFTVLVALFQLGIIFCCVSASKTLDEEMRGYDYEKRDRMKTSRHFVGK
ncbi:MAG: hypothetical protein Q4B70_14995 [Lachnospiraceae bacterium]|nr:hypothetical protein [Lachnospiraceae bacterium]